jgi:uncharacterized membrane protein (UPF0127 family)
MQSRTNFFLVRVLPFIMTVGGVGIVVFLFSFMQKDVVSIPDTVTMSVGDEIFSLRVAQTPDQRRQGLSGSMLAENEGMLFVFEDLGHHTLWMKDMLISLDMVWLDESHTVVHIVTNVHPETFPMVFAPKQKALYVLELSAGTVDRVGMRVGDVVGIDI